LGLNVVGAQVFNPSRLTPRRFRIYHLDIGGTPGIFQKSFATTAEAIAFSYEPEKKYQILVDHKKSYSIEEFKTFAGENKFDNGGRP
jgi:hypothetical protein